MQGLAKTEPGEGRLELVDLPTPGVGPEDVLVEVAYAGLCGSDVGIYKFKDAYRSIMSLPTVIGHEYAGRVVEVGEDVTGFEVGDRVVERPIRSCGSCFQCRTGKRNVCQNVRITGVHHHGAYAEYVAVPAEALNAIPAGLDLSAAALAEPASVAVRAVAENADIVAADRVLVEGPGPIGLLAAQVADRQGASVTVSGIDRDAHHRLPFAADLGYRTVNVSDRSLPEATDAITNGLGFDVVIDTTGAEAGIRAAGQAVRKGGQVVLVGQTGTANVRFTPFIRGEIDLQCSYASTWEDFERALRLLEDGDFAVEGFVDRYSILDSEAAFESFMSGDTCKPHFDLSTLRED